MEKSLAKWYYRRKRFKLSDAAKVWKKEGREEGIEVGRVEEQAEIARRLLSMNVAVEDVIKATGLSTEQIMLLSV